MLPDNLCSTDEYKLCITALHGRGNSFCKFCIKFVKILCKFTSKFIWTEQFLRCTCLFTQIQQQNRSRSPVCTERTLSRFCLAVLQERINIGILRGATIESLPVMNERSQHECITINYNTTYVICIIRQWLSFYFILLSF